MNHSIMRELIIRAAIMEACGIIMRGKTAYYAIMG
jgi:hypothetical protein